MFAGRSLFVDVDHALMNEPALFIGKIEMVAHTSRHLGKVAVVVLCLNTQNFQGSCRTDAECGPTKRTREQVVILGELQKQAKKTRDRVDEILGAESDEDERINKLVDAFVEQLVKRF
jgi:hypothetical protein